MDAVDHSEHVGKDVNCPECEKHRKHVKLVETKGQIYECPECHYIHLARR